MKTIRLLIILSATVLCLNSCQKDEYGNYVTYYKNKSVVIYVYSFEKRTPVPNYKMHIKAWITGTDLFPGPKHIDYCYSDETGKCTFLFVKKINARTVTNWGVAAGSQTTPPHFLFNESDVKDIAKDIILDTLFIY